MNKMDEEHHFEGLVTITNWAKTRRQRIVMETSFEEKEYNIYSPRFSS